jgi:hypothetical protein
MEGTTTWPDLAIGLYDRLTGRDAEIRYDFTDMDVFVPSEVGNGANHAHWRLNGTLRVTTRDGIGAGDGES